MSGGTRPVVQPPLPEIPEDPNISQLRQTLQTLERYGQHRWIGFLRSDEVDTLHAILDRVLEETRDTSMPSHSLTCKFASFAEGIH